MDPSDGNPDRLAMEGLSLDADDVRPDYDFDDEEEDLEMPFGANEENKQLHLLVRPPPASQRRQPHLCNRSPACSVRRCARWLSFVLVAMLGRRLVHTSVAVFLGVGGAVAHRAIWLGAPFPRP